jgi:nucleotide-binding universal stress UspA family protein
MVGLDLTSVDEILIRRVSELSLITAPDVVHFVHVDKDHEIPRYLSPELQTSIENNHEHQIKLMQKNVKEHFTNSDVEIQIEVISGKPFETLLKWVKDTGIDFFISGRKLGENGTGILPHKLLRKLSCPALFIPEVKMPGSFKILVPVDFSEHSMLAIKTALNLTDYKDLEIEFLHICQVPLGYYKSGKNYQEFSEIMKKNAADEFAKFIKPLNGDFDLNCQVLEKGSPAELICKESKEGNFDLVIMGSKGQSSGSIIILGSIAEKFIQLNDSSMTWIVKKPDEHIGFFEAIKKI